jgi:replicative superfamily II helicase
MNDFLSGIIDEALRKLNEAGCIQYDKEDDTLVPSQYGNLASFYYLTHETVQYFNLNLKAGLSI